MSEPHIEQAARLLSQAANSLINTPVVNNNGENPRESNEIVTSTPTTNTAQIDTTQRSRRARDEFRRLFAPYNTQPSNSRSAPSASRSAPSTFSQRQTVVNTPSRPRAKKRKAPKYVTVKFFCLAYTTQHDAPNCEEKQELLVAGLGEKKVTLPEETNANDLTLALKETYPKLQDSGGYEFLHAKPSSRELNVIREGENGYTIDFLKRFVGQGRVYIRPIQCDLDLTVTGTSKDRSGQYVVEEMCNNCLELFPMQKLREHVYLCKKDDDATNTERYKFK